MICKSISPTRKQRRFVNGANTVSMRCGLAPNDTKISLNEEGAFELSISPQPAAVTRSKERQMNRTSMLCILEGTVTAVQELAHGTCDQLLPPHDMTGRRLATPPFTENYRAQYHYLHERSSDRPQHQRQLHKPIMCLSNFL